VNLLLYVTLIASQALQATGLMVVKEGELKRPVSTMTIVAHRGSTYYLLTASHSVEDSKGVAGTYYFAPQGNDKALQELHLVAAGECTYVRIAGDFWCPDDFAVFSFESPDRHTFVPLGDAQKIALGASVGYAGFPGMYGLVWAVGTMAGRRIEGVLLHPPLWPYDFVVSIADGPGASGSSLIDLQQGKVVGVLNGDEDYLKGLVSFYPADAKLLDDVLAGRNMEGLVYKSHSTDGKKSGN
jgi:hypothetical protein